MPKKLSEQPENEGRERVSGWTITCPTCGHVGDEHDFAMSLADECFCPKGCEWFLLQTESEDDE